tara:strand:- start:7417 stop:7632 length:216 start_codon:yes stop_codon:yes gene_type:complete
MIETVVALLMFVNHEIKEHRIQDSMSMCLKGKRVAERQLKGGSSVTYKCIRSKAEIEIYMGEKHIKKIILD